MKYTTKKIEVNLNKWGLPTICWQRSGRPVSEYIQLINMKGNISPKMWYQSELLSLSEKFFNIHVKYDLKKTMLDQRNWTNFWNHKWRDPRLVTQKQMGRDRMISGKSQKTVTCLYSWLLFTVVVRRGDPHFDQRLMVKPPDVSDGSLA